MPKIPKSLKKRVRKIKKLANGDYDEQMKASKKCDKFFHEGRLKDGINISVIPKLLRIFTKFINSENYKLQEYGAYFITALTMTPPKENTKLVIKAGVISKIVRLLASPNQDVIEQSLRALANIAVLYPKKFDVNEILPTILQFLQSESKEICNLAADFLNNILYKCRKNIIDFLDVSGDAAIKILMKILESENDGAGAYAVGALFSICSKDTHACQYLLDQDVMKSMKTLCNRLFASSSGTEREDVAAESSVSRISVSKKGIDLLAIEFINTVTAYGETSKINIIIDSKILPHILVQISNGKTAEIKIESVEVIENIILAKPELIPSLINDHNILSLYCNNLQSKNEDLIITILTALKNIIDAFEDEESCRQKLEEFGYPWKLEKLQNQEIDRLSNLINDFVVYGIKPSEPRPVENCRAAPEMIAIENADDNLQGRKRPAHSETETSITGSKRSRISLENSFNQEKRPSCGNPLSRSSNNSPNLPEVASESNGIIQNDQHTHAVQSEFLMLSAQIPAVAANNDRNEIIKYWNPHGSMIHQYCETLGIQFNRNAFIPKITFDQITSNSRPDNSFTAENDKSGFSCFSILLTGNEDSANIIRDQINNKFIDDLETFDKEKIKEVTRSRVMLAEHFETIAALLDCRILVYCSVNGWKKYGNWETEDQMIPIFVLEKKENGYQIVLDLKND